MTLFRFCHAQKNAFAFFVALTLRQVAVGLRGLDFRLPVPPCSIDRLLMISLLRSHASLELKEGRFPIRLLKAADWRPPFLDPSPRSISRLYRSAQGRLDARSQLLGSDYECH